MRGIRQEHKILVGIFKQRSNLGAAGEEDNFTTWLTEADRQDVA